MLEGAQASRVNQHIVRLHKAALTHVDDVCGEEEVAVQDGGDGLRIRGLFALLSMAIHRFWGIQGHRAGTSKTSPSGLGSEQKRSQQTKKVAQNVPAITVREKAAQIVGQIKVVLQERPEPEMMSFVCTRGSLKTKTAVACQFSDPLRRCHRAAPRGAQKTSGLAEPFLETSPRRKGTTRQQASAAEKRVPAWGEGDDITALRWQRLFGVYS